jgi:phosphoenolpyruvate synthase/pyruvate phosphate dikinase
VDRRLVGGKAGVLGELADVGVPVPLGFVVTAAALDDPDRLAAVLVDAAARVGGARFAVRYSGAAEDLPDASYAANRRLRRLRTTRRDGVSAATVTVRMSPACQTSGSTSPPIPFPPAPVQRWRT